MQAFNLGKVQGARITASEQPAGKCHFYQRVYAALGDGSGAVADSLSAFEVVARFGVQFKALELLEGANVGVGVIEVGDQANVDQLFFWV